MTKLDAAASGYAAKFIAEHGRTTQPTHEAMAQTFAHCVRTPPTSMYPLIEAEILAMQTPPFNHLLRSARLYRNALHAAFTADSGRKEWRWDEAHQIARELMREYGPETYARIDTIAYRYA